VNQIFSLEQIYTFDSSLHHILLASLTFDPSVQQIFLPLTTGAKLFLVSESIKHSVKELWEFIVSNRIDIINTVPSLMNVLLEHKIGHDNLHFKYVILAGEVFSKNLYLRLTESLRAEKIINIYGPTEATINTTLYECKAEETNSTIPIGRPLPNYHVYILDEQQNLVPIGEYGEICISGVGLARGYVNSPELTTERFVANPFTPGERMYRTGDYGRWDEGGNIEFLGRRDYQVKVGGIRVEPGEVETVLAEHPRVQEAVVIDQEDHEGKTRLVSYVVSRQEQALSIDDLRRFLEDKLPQHMVPSAFVIMDAMPLTPHGKVDRRALPAAVEMARGDQGNTYVAPRDELESRLTVIWENILGVKPIGVKDHFFNLGGSSLLAMILFAEIEKTFGKRFPLATIIDAPTIEDLGRVVGNEECSGSWSPLVALQAKGSKPPFFCVHGHRGNVVGFYGLATYLGKEQPFYALQAQGLDGRPLGELNISNMAADYIKKVRTVQPEGPYFLGGWCMGGVLAFEMAQQLQRDGQKVALVAMIESNHPSGFEFPPNSTALRRLIYSVIDRVRYEIMAFRSLENKDKLSHLLKKFSTALAFTQVKIEKLIEWFLAKFRLSVRHSWSYKMAALAEANEKALLSYEPRPYRGRVAIFSASKQPLGIYPDPSLGWSELLEGESELHEIPGHHLNSFIEPSLQVLAEELRKCLDKAAQTYEPADLDSPGKPPNDDKSFSTSMCSTKEVELND
jgi:thioesterase domain-containing protein/acyl carrier protein